MPVTFRKDQKMGLFGPPYCDRSAHALSLVACANERDSTSRVTVKNTIHETKFRHFYNNFGSIST